MKTPQDWATAWIIRQEEFSSYAKDGLVAESFIAEIQRDAREGMVPQDDVLELLLPVTKALQHAGDITHENRIGWALQAIEAFEQKHPNLFTK